MISFCYLRYDIHYHNKCIRAKLHSELNNALPIQVCLVCDLHASAAVPHSNEFTVGVGEKSVEDKDGKRFKPRGFETG